VVCKLGFRENIFLPQVLMDEQADLKERDPEAWAHVWDGQCRPAVEGAVYGAELARARDEGRLTSVPYEPSAPVHCFWDLGWSDSVSVWMAQAVGLEFRVIDFLQGSQKSVDAYVRELNQRPYVWGEDWLPHDARARTLAAAGRSIESQLRGLGRQVRIVETVSVPDGINAARGVLGRCWFDEDRCADGLHALRHYHYKVGDDGWLARRPEHDWSSHAADAFRYLAVSLEAKRPKPAARDRPALSWMG
jgi:phage terminase large subunit